MATPQNFHVVTSPTHFQELLSQDLSRVSLINFWAPWAAPCAQMNDVVLELARRHPALLVLQVEAEEQPDIAESFEVEAVPAFVVLRGHTLLARVSGADAPALTNAIAAHLRPASVQPKAQSDALPAPPEGETPAQLEERLRGLMNQQRVMLFMKGTPDAPRCGFSRKTVGILRDHGVQFGSFDILSDESVRQGLKVVNNWPTFPQLIVNGEFVGGLDIIQEMIENGEFEDIVVKGQ
ncbi:glutaredoxin [Gloeophyllum trabeum ATCC 11539]|uniref:Glutaredoxin n=1 Tax=Gloeophyllum trabeum (strain ATCC 11539 / FP-39264 / Madison 617) TaxID=670483 RepID=S7RHZ0_GLOTA|nr:glutaredoxin [Gloeophyllum trabeum ATCC 11539]EPQ53900.1 glutaredoxin [Gloeophyllum trabeum ATCC 11539]